MMSKEEAIVIKIVQEMVRDDSRSNVRLNSRLIEDLGLDSMALIGIALTLEADYKLDLENSEIDLAKLETVQDIADQLRNWAKPTQ